MDEERLRSDSSSALPAPDRLDSWKEIASYLRRDIRTVQRWEEEESLPVHRHQHNRQASVYAFKSELDLWRAERKPLVQAELENNGTQSANGNRASEISADGGAELSGKTNGRSASGDGGEPSQIERATSAPGFLNHLPIGRRIGIAILLLGLLGASTFALLRRNRHLGLESVSFQNNKLVAANQENSIAWTYDLPFPASSLINTVMVPDDGAYKGTQGVAGLFKTGTQASDRLCFFSASGKLLWQFSPTDYLLLGPTSYGPIWRGDTMKAFSVAGQPRIAISVQHDIWWPSMLFVFDLEGHPLGRFVNAGWIRRIEALEKSSGTLLFATGMNNAYDGGMLAVLDATQVSGASPSPPGSEYECTNCQAGRPLKYFVFPRSEVNRVTASPLIEARIRTLGGEIVLVTFEAQQAESNVWSEGVYRFSPDFHLISASYDDRYWDLHRQLELQGKIHHKKATCPERFGPQTVRAWDPDHGWTVLRPNQK